MKPQDYSMDAEQALTEARALLVQQVWDIRDSLFLEGEHVCILLDPYPANEMARFNVPVTILLLHGRAGLLSQTPLLLTDAGGAVYYGRLNPRGQVLFRDLPSGAYTIGLTGDPAHLQESMTWLPAQAQRSLLASSAPLRLIAPGSAGGNSVFRTADGSLAVILRTTETGELLISFESTDPKWEGRLLGIAWRSVSSLEKPMPPWKLLLALLSRAEQSSVSVATLNLGRVPLACDLMLPELPFPDEILSTELAEVLEASLAQPLSPSSLAAWHQILERHTSLPAVVRQVIVDALGRDREAGRIWKLAAANLYCLASTVFVQLSLAAASFGRLAAPLTPRLAPVAALRAGGGPDADAIELLELPHLEANLVLRVSLGPSPRGQGTLVVAVSTAKPPRPIQQAKVSLRDAAGALLESTPTDEDGLAVFQALEAGVYQIHVYYDDTIWQVPLSLEASHDT